MFKHSFSRRWALLTQRDTHLTMDTDERDLVGFLRSAQLKPYLEELHDIARPDTETDDGDIGDTVFRGAYEGFILTKICRDLHPDATGTGLGLCACM